MSDGSNFRRGAAMSTLFFGHEEFPFEREDDEGPDATPPARPVTWLTGRVRDEREESEKSRGY